MAFILYSACCTNKTNFCHWVNLEILILSIFNHIIFINEWFLRVVRLLSIKRNKSNYCCIYYWFLNVSWIINRYECSRKKIIASFISLLKILRTIHDTYQDDELFNTIKSYNKLWQIKCYIIIFIAWKSCGFFDDNNIYNESQISTCSMANF